LLKHAQARLSRYGMPSALNTDENAEPHNYDLHFLARSGRRQSLSSRSTTSMRFSLIALLKSIMQFKKAKAFPPAPLRRQSRLHMPKPVMSSSPQPRRNGVPTFSPSSLWASALHLFARTSVVACVHFCSLLLRLMGSTTGIPQAPSRAA
jgi:hypothetical protein